MSEYVRVPKEAIQSVIELLEPAIDDADTHIAASALERYLKAMLAAPDRPLAKSGKLTEEEIEGVRPDDLYPAEWWPTREYLDALCDMALRTADLERQLAAQEQALRELVRLKSLKDWLTGRDFETPDEWQALCDAQRDYDTNKPLAWEAARKVIAELEPK